MSLHVIYSIDSRTLLLLEVQHSIFLVVDSKCSCRVYDVATKLPLVKTNSDYIASISLVWSHLMKVTELAMVQALHTVKTSIVVLTKKSLFFAARITNSFFVILTANFKCCFNNENVVVT